MCCKVCYSLFNRSLELHIYLLSYKLNFPFRLYLACRCYASIHNLTKPKQGSPFIDLFSFAKLASIVLTISFAGFTGTNGSICFHQVSYLKQFLLSSLSRLLGKFPVKKKPVPRNKFTIKPSFYVRSNS